MWNKLKKKGRWWTSCFASRIFSAFMEKRRGFKEEQLGMKCPSSVVYQSRRESA